MPQSFTAIRVRRTWFVSSGNGIYVARAVIASRVLTLKDVDIKRDDPINAPNEYLCEPFHLVLPVVPTQRDPYLVVHANGLTGLEADVC